MFSSCKWSIKAAILIVHLAFINPWVCDSSILYLDYINILVYH